jgi:hypothetical protein
MKNNISINHLENDFRLKRWVRINHVEIICPWCYCMTVYSTKEEEINYCEVCQRLITEGDLENEIL